MRSLQVLSIFFTSVVQYCIERVQDRTGLNFRPDSRSEREVDKETFDFRPWALCFTLYASVLFIQ
jgi:hypothetical protein